MSDGFTNPDLMQKHRIVQLVAVQDCFERAVPVVMREFDPTNIERRRVRRDAVGVVDKHEDGVWVDEPADQPSAPDPVKRGTRPVSPTSPRHLHQIGERTNRTTGDVALGRREMIAAADPMQLTSQPGKRTPHSGYRLFSDDDVARLSLVRQLQELGFTLDEVIDALQAHDRGGATCASEQWRLNTVTARIDGRIAELQHARRSIDDALDACRAGHCGMTSRAPAG